MKYLILLLLLPVVTLAKPIDLEGNHLVTNLTREYCINFYSKHYNIDSKLISSIIAIESSGISTKVGTVGEIGLMQVRPKFSEFTKQDLFNECTNIYAGTKFLEYVKKYCKHKIDNTFVVCYNTGVRGGSKINNPKEFYYYKNFIKEYEGSL